MEKYIASPARYDTMQYQRCGRSGVLLPKLSLGFWHNFGAVDPYDRSKDELCERAFDLLEQLKAENNYITRMWQQCGLPIESAGDSQALIQLKKEYCDRKDCLRCRFGYEYLKSPKIPVNPTKNDS